MATALEQFLSSASQPIEDPLSSLGQGIQAGFNLAAQKERLRIAAEENQLRADQIKGEYLAKGINAMTALSKVKNASQRRILQNVTLKYLQNGGLQGMNEETVKGILSDQKSTQTIVQALESRGINDPALITQAELFDIAGADFETAMEKIAELDAKMKEGAAKRSGDLQRALEVEQVKSAYKAGTEQQKLFTQSELGAQEKLQESLQKAGGIPIRGLQVLSKYTDQPLKMQMLIAGYTSSVGDKAKYIDENEKNLQDASLGQQEELSSIRQMMDQARDLWWDPNKSKEAESLAREARLRFGKLQASMKSPGSRAEKLLGVKINEDRTKDAAREAKGIQTDINKAFGQQEGFAKQALVIMNKPKVSSADILGVMSQIIRAGGAGAAQTEGDAARALAPTLAMDAKKLESYLTSDPSGVEMPQDELNRLKTNMGLIVKTLYADKARRLKERIVVLQEDPRIGQYFKPGGAQYNGLKRAYPNIFESMERAESRANVGNALRNAAKKPITVTRSEIISKLQQQALRSGSGPIVPSETAIENSYKAYIKKYGPEGVIIQKDK